MNNNGYAEAVNWVNGMIQNGCLVPTFRVRGTEFERHFNHQMSERKKVDLTDAQIKGRLESLGAIMKEWQAQEQEKQAGARRNNTVTRRLQKALKTLEQELGADVLWNDAKKRYDVAWR